MPTAALAALEHVTRTEGVATQVRARPAGQRITIRKATHGHSVRDQAYKRACHPVDVSALDRVLHIDETALTATVEGQVTMAQLCAATLRLGLAPPVVPEFPGFTVAGLINGEGIQSSSHRQGLFTHNVLEVELLLGDGRTITASRTEHPELFTTLTAGSLGTLAIVTAATVRLVPAKPFVVTTIQRHRTLEAYVAALEAAVGGPDFLEGVIFGPDEYVVVTGQYADTPGGAPIYDPGARGAPYYYQRVRARALEGATLARDAIATAGYFTRSARGLWWMLECQVGLPFATRSERVRRRLDVAIERALATRGFDANGHFTTEQRERCLVNQDMGVWLPRLADGVRYVQRELGVYPIWNCPIAHPEGNGVTRTMVDIGIYGEPMVPGYHHRPKMRALQQWVDSPSLWGVSYLTREELAARGIYDRARYLRVRERYAAADAFLDLEDKVVWVEPGDDDGPGKIPLWRLYRSYGPWWPAKLAAGLAAVGLSAWAWSRLRAR